MRAGAAAAGEGRVVKRRLLTIAIFLLAGAVVNVAVAWGCARWSCWLDMILAPVNLVTTSAPAGWWLDNVPQSWPDKPAYAVTRGTGWYLFTHQVWPLDIEAFFMLDEFRFGVPTKSLACYKLSADAPRRWTSCWRYAIGRFGGDYPLPLRPIWPGFAINTLFYAAILWPLILGPFALRRLIRRRRGLCPACGYDLRHAVHEACPECGVSA